MAGAGKFRAPGRDDASPVFRAVMAVGRRRGLRLEKSFWSALETIGKRDGVKISDIIERLEENGANTGNLASLLRVYALGWLESCLGEVEEKTAPEKLHALVNACPSPALALSEGKGLRFYNAAFLRYIRMSMPAAEFDQMHTKLQLKIDMNTGDLIERLKSGEAENISLGFVIGLNNRTVNGKLKAVLAPSGGEDFVIGYILS